ncbi:MAG: hypothetical protein K0R98_1513 [Rickettsiaceae bacterium]|nr:hypothetical protein [Rickettsiaceae bacterium]
MFSMWRSPEKHLEWVVSRFEIYQRSPHPVKILSASLYRNKKSHDTTLKRVILVFRMNACSQSQLHEFRMYIYLLYLCRKKYYDYQ